MKRVSLALAGVLLLGAEGNEVAHWPSDRPVAVIDEVAGTINPGQGRLRDWRGLRRKVLTRWAASGVTFIVTERDPGSCSPIAAPQGALLLCRDVSAWGWPGLGGVFPGDHIPHGTAAISYPKARAVVCHEIGHALGLGHSNEGCMAGEGVVRGHFPSPSDLALLADARQHTD